MLKTIMTPLDGSPRAELALEAASLLAQRFHAELLLVHVLAPDAAPERAAQAQSYLESVGGRLQSAGVILRPALLSKEPAEGIADEALLSDVDLIVMTTHGRKGLDALLHPSVTWQVLRQTDAPILACKCASDDAPAPAQDLLRFLTDPKAPLLVSLDGSVQSEVALPLAQALARAFGNPLLLVRAADQPMPVYPTGAAWGGIGMGDDALLIARAAQQSEDEAMSYLEGKRDELASAGLQVLIETGPGPAALLIQETARKHQAGLIVMASHGRGWLGRLVLGSVAQSVLREIEIPVLLVRRLPPSTAGEQLPAQPEATEHQTEHQEAGA
jgi:nucleotide-binding universal stress UspA family protein